MTWNYKRVLEVGITLGFVGWIVLVVRWFLF